PNQKYPVTKTEEQWREELTPEQYRMARQAGTEAPFTGALLNNKHPGTYKCVGCGQPLFPSATKFDSGSGWPSFFQPLTPDGVEEKTDTTHGMVRTEVLCQRCGSHLGHLFPDGPNP